MVYVGSSHVAQLVRQALAADSRTSHLAIEVSYNRGTLTLIGNVATREDREAVELVALAQPGIDSLVLAVDVEDGGGQLAVSGPISRDELSR